MKKNDKELETMIKKSLLFSFETTKYPSELKSLSEKILREVREVKLHSAKEIDP